MATGNFSKINASNYFAILDTYEETDEKGDKQTFERDEWDFRDILDNIKCNGNDGHFPYPSDGWNKEMDARNLCESKSQWETYGKKANSTETDVESVICVRSGYYSGAVLDYDVMVQTCDGDTFHLSEYETIDNMMHDYLDAVEDTIAWRGSDNGWNVGTFKINKERIRKWITERIQKEIDICEEFCRKNCDVELSVSARFSNGETWYSKVA